MKKPDKMHTLIYILAASVLIQAVPYGRTHQNPPGVREPKWNSPQTRALAKRACFDCHSNETVWPWYASVAPVSWLVYGDVEEARSDLNFSNWLNGRRDGKNPAKISKEILKGDMPPLRYRLLHPKARLTESERRKLAGGLSATLQQQNR